MPGALASTLIEARGVRKATEAQERSGERGIELIREQFGKTEQALTPFIRGETPAQLEQSALLGLQGEEARIAAESNLETPSTRRLREEGLRGLDQRFSAVGGLGGSNRLKALSSFLQQRDVQGKDQRFNQLGAITQQPLSAALGLGERWKA